MRLFNIWEMLFFKIWPRIWFEPKTARLSLRLQSHKSVTAKSQVGNFMVIVRGSKQSAMRWNSASVTPCANLACQDDAGDDGA